MRDLFSQFRKRLYRKIRYRLSRPSPPLIEPRFDGPVIVVGSAPISHEPANVDETFKVISINGSQSVTSGWRIKDPDFTFLQWNQIRGTNTNAVEVRRVLSGKRTGTLYVLLWRKNDRARLEKGLRAFDYNYDNLVIVDRYERMALIDKMVGHTSLEIHDDDKCSNGVNAVLFALFNGATAVIITGINPDSSGHAYNQADLSRLHRKMDADILRKLLEKGHPIFTTDLAVSVSIGIPLWPQKDDSEFPTRRRPI